MSHRKSSSRLLPAVSKRLRRVIKTPWQRLVARPQQPKTSVFVVGCQRSGTSILAEILNRPLMTTVYGESDQRAFRNFRLLPQEVIEQLINKSYAPIVVFKPVCESHLTDQVLAHYPRAKAIWIYRYFQDVVLSAVAKWKGHQKDIMQWIHERDWKQLGWRGERLSPEMIELVDRLYSDQMTSEEGACLFWYLRNRFYFDLNLHRNPEVLLVKYEDLVCHPLQYFPRVFEFIGCPFHAKFVRDIHSGSVGKKSFPPISQEIRTLCEELMAALDEQYRR